MNINYVQLAATVRALIKATGREVSLQQLSGTPGNAAKPWEGPLTPTVAFTQDVPGVFVPASGAELGEQWVSAQLLATVSEVLLVAPDTINDFSPTNQIVDGGQVFAISWVKVLKPANQILLYAMGVSR